MMEDIKKTELESENVNITEEPEDVVIEEQETGTSDEVEDVVTEEPETGTSDETENAATEEPETGSSEVSGRGRRNGLKKLDEKLKNLKYLQGGDSTYHLR